jgi:hypothetical protein
VLNDGVSTGFGAATGQMSSLWTRTLQYLGQSRISACSAPFLCKFVWPGPVWGRCRVLLFLLKSWLERYLQMEARAYGGLLDVSDLLKVVVGPFLEALDIHGYDKMVVGDGTSHFSYLYEDNVVVVGHLEDHEEE